MSRRDLAILWAVLAVLASLVWGLHQRQLYLEGKLEQTYARIRALEYRDHPTWKVYDDEHPAR